MQGLDEGSATLNAENPGSGSVSYRQPDGLILSTANLYFTSHDGNTAIVWRTAQSSNPGREFLLWSEPHARFGDIVFAQVDSIWYGYFFKFELKTGRISIMRVPLTGGEEAMVINQEPIENVDVMNSHRNLVTDGMNLYWQDDHSVRKMPIGGGTITILDTASLNTPTAGLALQNGKLIYASVADIIYVPTSGAITLPLARTIAHAPSRVTTFYAISNGVYWGEESGDVRLKVGSTTTTLQSTSDMVPTSITAIAGIAEAWTQCGSQSCQLQYRFPIGEGGIPISADALGVSVTSSGNVFWGDASGVHRQLL
jgi:hypothetical protein